MYCDEVLFNMGRSLKAKMASMAGPNGWRWPRSRNPVVMEIIARTRKTFFPNLQQEDSGLFDC